MHYLWRRLVIGWIDSAMGHSLIFKYWKKKKVRWICWNHSETQKQWGRGGDIILGKCSDCILRLCYSTFIPETEPKWSHWPCHCLTCLLFPSSAPLQVLRIWGWALRAPPPNKPPSAKESSQRTESNRSNSKTFWANNLWLMQCSFEIKMIHMELPYEDISLSSLAYSVCTMFHSGLRFNVLSGANKSKYFWKYWSWACKRCSRCPYMLCSLVFGYIMQIFNSEQTRARFNLCTI